MFNLINGVSWIVIGVAAVLGFSVGYVIRKFKAEFKVGQAERISKKMLDDAAKEIETRKKESDLEVKEQVYKARQEFEQESKERRQELLQLEKRLTQREENIDRKVGVIEKKEKDLLGREKSLSDQEKAYREKTQEYERLIAKEKEALQKVARLGVDEAKRILLKKVENEVKFDAGVMIKRIEDEAKETAEKKAREIISLAINRCAGEHTAETTVSVVSLPSDDLKGRIIGREGRNIRALEAATGVDVIIDDTPEAVVISAFDPIRRETARMALEKLIADGRIHPARVEEICEKASKELEAKVKEIGEAAVLEVGLMAVHPEIVKALGKLKYRTSYGQNMLQHSKECAAIMGVMAAEIGLNVKLAKRIGLLHDVGKSVSHEVEGSHALIGAEMLKRYGENKDVVHAVAAHHHDIDQGTPYAILVEAADAVSAARPGARGETFEAYVQRLENLEEIANSFKGVEKSFAIQAGREIRVMVEPEKITDVEAQALAREVSKKIENELEYPGQVKVVVVREVRAVEYAK